jgi:hypothetical protein
VATLSVERDVIQLLKTQYLIEKELRRIGRYRLAKRDVVKPATKLAEKLCAAGYLAPRFAKLTRRLLSITPRLVGKPLRDADARYVNSVGADAVFVLRTMPTHPNA